MKKLNKKFKKKWVEALRSGKYTQGTGRLRTFQPLLHCCLGVACEVDEDSCTRSSGNMDMTVPFSVDSNRWGLSEEVQSKLIEFNDKKNKSFKWIAGYIERYL